MRVSISRRFLCWALIVILPSSLLGQTTSAILHAQGGVLVNGYEANDAAAIFTGDTLDTKPGFPAKLSLEGSAVSIQPESVTKFQGDFLELEHGSVSVETSKSFKVKVHCITVTPVSNDWTQYDVDDVNGKVQVAARKSDVNVEIDSVHLKPSVDAGEAKGGTVREGEQHTYDESELCAAPPRLPGVSSPLNAKWIEIGAAAGGGGILVCVLLLCKSKSSISPAQP
jgi:hypothetical protein